MEFLPFFIFLSIPIFIFIFFLTKKKSKLPPGPLAIPLLGNPLLFQESEIDLAKILRDVHCKYGPIVTLQLGACTAIFISDRELAHKALVRLGDSLSYRPPNPASPFLHFNDKHTITGSAYGPLWQLLKQNMVSGLLDPSRVELFARGRKSVLGHLTNDLYAQLESSTGGVVVPYDSFVFSQFSLLTLMCFGEQLDESFVRKVHSLNRDLLVYEGELEFLAFFPSAFKYFYRPNRYKSAVDTFKELNQLCMPFLEARRQHKKTEGRYEYSYVDSLFDLKLPGSGRGLTDTEMLTLVGEIMNQGTHYLSAALQWIMAELVKNQDVQKRLSEEVDSVSGGDSVINEEELRRMPYLKAVVLEALRRHPPSDNVIPHAAVEDVEFEGYVIPKNVQVHFSVVDIGRDERTWEEPLEFKPERFLVANDAAEEVVDLMGSREIKMMPFGVGQRICPGIGLAILHLEYFVANLVKEFEWKQVEGEDVDLSEKSELGSVMKNPLRARLVPKRHG